MAHNQSMRLEMLRLAETLLRQTMEGKIKWLTTDKEDQFLFTSTKSSLLISGTYGNYDAEDEGDFSLELLNRGGSVAARFTVGFEMAYDFREGQNYRLLKRLYLEAQNRALEIDTTLEDIHRALGIETGSESESSNDGGL